MARDGSAQFAKIKLTIWTDDDFLALTPNAKLLYFFLLTNPKTSRVGVLELIPAKWATRLRIPRADVDDALVELRAARFVLVDEDTAEVGIRTKVKHDPPATALQVKGVWAAWERIESHAMGNAMGNAMPDVMWEKIPKGFAAPLPAPSPDRECDGEWHSLSHGESDGEWVPREGDADTDVDTDTDTDTEHSSSHSDSPPDSPPTFDLDATLAAAVEIIGHRDGIDGRLADPSVRNPRGLRTSIEHGYRSAMRAHADFGLLVHDHAAADAFADLVIPPPAAPAEKHPADCGTCDGTGWRETDSGDAYRCDQPTPPATGTDRDPAKIATIRQETFA